MLPFLYVFHGLGSLLIWCFYDIAIYILPATGSVNFRATQHTSPKIFARTSTKTIQFYTYHIMGAISGLKEDSGY